MKGPGELLLWKGELPNTHKTKQKQHRTYTHPTSPNRQSSVAWGAHVFNNRDNTYVAELSTASYMSGCDVNLNVTFFDIGNTQEGAIESYRDAFLFAERPTDVIIADIYSSRTKTVSFLGKLGEELYPKHAFSALRFLVLASSSQPLTCLQPHKNTPRNVILTRRARARCRHCARHIWIVNVRRARFS